MLLATLAAAALRPPCTTPHNDCRPPAAARQPSAPNTLDRRALVSRSAACLAAPLVGRAAAAHALAAGSETVAPASDFNRLQTGKPRPETGCILLEELQASGDTKAPTVSAELATTGGVAVTVVFDSAWPVARGMYYDVEARSSEGDSAYVHVRTLPEGKDVFAVPASYLTSSVFNAFGRWSTYGAPTDIKVSSDVTKGQTRYLEVAFSVLSQAGSDSPRKGVIAAVQPSGSKDAVMLVSSTTSPRWKKGADVNARKAADSFRVARTRATGGARAAASDYRYENRGGLVEGSQGKADTVRDLLEAEL